MSSTAPPQPRPASTGSARPAARRPNAMGAALGIITRLAGSDVLDRWGWRERAERTAFHATRGGFVAAGVAARTFTAVKRATGPTRLPNAKRDDLWDLTPTEDQQMLVDVVREFATERIRPAAEHADATSSTAKELLETAAELGIWQTGVPESLGGLAEERSTVTNVLVAEALAQGDLGIAVSLLAPAAVGTAISLWGTGDQQATYLPSFVGDDPPRAALAITEPQPLFDAFAPATRAIRTPDGYRLEGRKSLVPSATRAELFVVGATVFHGDEAKGPALFVVEGGHAGISVRPEPAMGLRAADTGQVRFEGVVVPASARLGAEGDDAYDAYAECVRLSRLAWCALAVGTGQAVLDYVIPYVNSREAFGEPISNRQGVAFPVADMATELAGMRLATLRAASRVEQGLDHVREIALARRLCTEHGMRIGSDGVQLLGGHGYVKEHPVERWYRDLRAVAVMDGVVLV